MNSQTTKIIRCTSAEEAVHAVRSLIDRGVRRTDIEVISSEPIQEVESLLAGKSRLPLVVVSGAAVGVISGLLLASGTARLYPINTGGMPIVSLLPAGIVAYEVMMLIAILSCFATLLFEAKLLRRRPAADQACTEPLAEGEVLVLARLNPSETPDRLTDRLAPGVGD